MRQQLAGGSWRGDSSSVRESLEQGSWGDLAWPGDRLGTRQHQCETVWQWLSSGRLGFRLGAGDRRQAGLSCFFQVFWWRGWALWRVGRVVSSFFGGASFDDILTLDVQAFETNIW